VDDEQLESELGALRPAAAGDYLARRLKTVRYAKRSLADPLFAAWMAASALAACIVVGVALWQISTPPEGSASPGPSAQGNVSPMDPVAEYNRLFASR
jgi:hypothetical protein